MAIDLDLQGQIWFKKSNFLVSPLLEIHNQHITTREPWAPRLLHRPDCFMVSILWAYLYTRLFHSLITLHAYWSRQPRVFWHLTSLLSFLLNVGVYTTMNTAPVESLWLSDTTWWQAGSTLAQVMACCLMAPSHNLNQCWFIHNIISWHSLDWEQFHKNCSTESVACIKKLHSKLLPHLPETSELTHIPLVLHICISKSG